jgi:hypothetical protein
MKYSEQQLNVIARSMALGSHGSFAKALAGAYWAADGTNRETLLSAFEDIFDRVARFKDIEPTQSESYKLFIERRISMLDKKLYQGHISQDEYESMANELKEATQ